MALLAVRTSSLAHDWREGSAQVSRDALSFNERFSHTVRHMELVPGRAPEYLTADGVGLFRAEDRVLQAMLDGWRAQLLARGLTVGTIKGMSRNVAAFQAYTNDYPWSWAAHDLDEYFAHRRSQERPLEVRTLRTYGSSIRAFCSFLCDPRYRWVALCEQPFGDVPSSDRLRLELAATHESMTPFATGRRAFTRPELQTLFDVLDDLVDREYAAAGQALAARAARLDRVQGLLRLRAASPGAGHARPARLRPNPHVPTYGRFGR